MWQNSLCCHTMLLLSMASRTREPEVPSASRPPCRKVTTAGCAARPGALSAERPSSSNQAAPTYITLPGRNDRHAVCIPKVPLTPRQLVRSLLTRRPGPTNPASRNVLALLTCSTRPASLTKKVPW